MITASGGEIWAFSLPVELVHLIADRSANDNTEIVKSWSEIDEFKWGWNLSQVESLFGDLVELSTKASSNDKSLVYWGRL